MADTARRRLFWLLAVSCAVKLVYVFLLTEYSQYLFSDFFGYWDRALQRLEGRDLDYHQWAVWPPLPHILLTFFFRIIDALGLGAYRLEAVLAANVALSTAGVAFVYGIVLRLAASSRAALVVAAIYAFAFPLVYFNAFVMSEHPSVAALLAAVWLLVRYPGHIGYVSAAGALLALAVGMRPAFGLIAIPCGLYVLLAGQFARFSIKRAAMFSAAFLFVIGLVAAEVNRISHGQVRGLSANGGINFYFAQCRTHEVFSQHSIYSYQLVPPSTVQRVENGSVLFKEPFHNQAFYTNIGWQCVRAQPGLWWRNFAKLRDIFFGPLLPHVDSAFGYPVLLEPFRWLGLALALVLPLGFACVRSRRAPGAALLAGIVFVSFATQYAFNAEHRYLYPIFGLLLALNAWIAFELYRRWTTTKRLAFGIVAALGLGLLSLAVQSLAARARTPTLIDAAWFRTEAPFRTGGLTPAGRFQVNTLRFPEGDALIHPVRGQIQLPDPPQNLEIRFDTCLDVREAGRFEFVVASDDGFELKIDDRVVASHRQARPYRTTTGDAGLGVGRHRYSLSYSQEAGRLGVTALWREVLPSGMWMPAVGLLDVGEASKKLGFLPPAECRSPR